MSLYNMVNGANPAVFFVLPMLELGHPDELPRFRDCFVEAEEIHVYTRVGGGNRDCGYGEERLQWHTNFLRDFDDDFDSTYATYCFSVPEKWKADFAKVIEGKLNETSADYQALVKETFPKIASKLEDAFKANLGLR